MSKWSTTYNVILKNEGGYNKATAGSGETYKGIDRRYNPQWPGWKIIDQIKASRGNKGIKEEERFNSNPQLESLVSEFYKQYIGKLVNIDSINNQIVANMVADFLVHKQYDAVNVINKSIAQMASVVTAPTAITAPAINAINTMAGDFYKKLRTNRIAYYQNPSTFGSSLKFSPEYTKAFIRRVNAFPVAIPLSLSEAFEKLKQYFS